MTATVVFILLAAAFGIAAGASLFLVRLVGRRRRREKPPKQGHDSQDLRTW